MKKIEIEINRNVIEKSLTELKSLKEKSFKVSESLLLSKGYATSSEKKVLNSFIQIETKFDLLIDETINFISQAKQEFIEFDEEYAKTIKNS